MLDSDSRLHCGFVSFLFLFPYNHILCPCSLFFTLAHATTSLLQRMERKKNNDKERREREKMELSCTYDDLLNIFCSCSTTSIHNLLLTCSHFLSLVTKEQLIALLKKRVANRTISNLTLTQVVNLCNDSYVPQRIIF